MRRLTPLAALLLAAACADAPEQTGSSSQALGGVVEKWKVASQTPFVYMAPRADGSVLATTRDDVVSISDAGGKSTLYDGPESAPPRLILGDGSDGFGVVSGGTLTRFDGSGAQKASIALGPVEYGKLIPGSLFTFVPRVSSIDGEHGRALEARIFDDTGKLSTKFAAADLVQSRTVASHVVWATRTHLTKTKLDGVQVWSLPISVQRFEIDDGARFSIVNRAGDTRLVELYDQQQNIGKSTFEAPIWNLAIGPQGQYAAANSKTTLRVFKGGKVLSSIALGSVYPVSIDVSDLGYVLVGSQDARHSSLVRLYDATGTLKWSQAFANDDNAYRPEVRFAPSGAAFVVRDKTGLSYFVMEAP